MVLLDKILENFPWWEDLHGLWRDNISKTTLCSVESVQLITENYRKVPSNTELYRKWTKKLAYKPYLKISLDLLCIKNKPFA